MTDYAKHVEVLDTIGQLSPNERAAVDAAIDLMRAAAAVEPLKTSCEYDGCRSHVYEAKLAAAKAEIKRVTAERDEMTGRLDGSRGVVAEYQVEAARAQAEIERLRDDNAHQSRVLSADILALSTKLTNLRAAAEFAQMQLKNGQSPTGAVLVLGHAIEASR
jgi:chromosome segregation ATPase